jgi:hypothetical protein
MGALISEFHRGQKQCASQKVRMYGCNLYLLSKSLIESLAKRETSMYVSKPSGREQPVSGSLFSYYVSIAHYLTYIKKAAFEMAACCSSGM